MRLIALKPLTYNLRARAAGDAFEATERDGRHFIARNLAREDDAAASAEAAARKRAPSRKPAAKSS